MSSTVGDAGGTSETPDRKTPTALAEVDVSGVPVAKKMTRSQLKSTREALLRFTEAVDDVDCIVLAGGLGFRGSGFRDSGKRKSTEEDVRECCLRQFHYPKEPLKDTVHVILDSEGGSLDSAFKTVLFLRRFAKRIRVYVPREAKSAATLIALGADEVVMSPFAELGPLDTQIKDPRNPTKNVSALDCYRSVDYVQEFGLRTLPKSLEVLLQETDGRSPLSDLITPATKFALSEIVPMLAQVKALDFGGWGRTLQIGEMYARALQLRLREESNEQEAEKVAKKLVYGYPHHLYPIDYGEADKIGFNVSTMTAEEYDASFDVAEAHMDSRCVGFLEDIVRMENRLSAVEADPDAKSRGETRPPHAKSRGEVRPADAKSRREKISINGARSPMGGSEQSDGPRR